MEENIFDKNLHKAADYIKKADELDEHELVDECQFICSYLKNTILGSNTINAKENHKKAREIDFKATGNIDKWFKDRLKFYKEKREEFL